MRFFIYTTLLVAAVAYAGTSASEDPNNSTLGIP
jgi:hypothetical protein